MANRDLPPLVVDLLYAQEHGLLQDDLGQAVQRILARGISDTFSQRELDRRVHDHVVAEAFRGPFRLPQLCKQAEPQIILGTDEQGVPVTAPLQYMNAHVLTLGGTGSGKTSSCRFRILQIAQMVEGGWYFDFRKREYAPLRRQLRKVGVRLLVVPARRLKTNPLQLPQAVLPADWASRVADMLVQVLELPPRATKLLHVAILQLYQRFGVQRDRDPCPTLFDLREALASAKDANAQARMAVLDSLDPLLLSLGPQVLAYRRAWSSHDLARMHIVFEFDGVAEADKDLLLNSLLLPEFTSRVAQGISNPRMNLFICCDEALRLVAASNPRSSMADLLGLIRGTGIGLDLSVQTAEILPSILSNTATKFIGRCGSAADYDRISAAMGLNTDQRRWLSLHLEPGLFVCQLGEGAWRHPFVLRVPHIRLPSDTQATRADEDLDELLRLPVEPATEFQRWSPNGTPVEIHDSGVPVNTQERDSVDATELAFLRAVVESPGRRAAEYPHLANISTRRCHQLRKRLVEHGYLREHAVMTNTRGRPCIVLEPTAAGIERLQNSST